MGRSAETPVLLHPQRTARPVDEGPDKLKGKWWKQDLHRVNRHLMGTLGISWARAGSFFHPWAIYGEKTLTALPSWIDREAWDGYVEMRKTIKKPLTPRAEKLVVHTLYQLREKGHDPNAALDESSVHNWLDIYPPRAKEIPNMKRDAYQPEAPMTAEEKAKADEARGRVMQLVGRAFRKVA